MVYAVLVYFAAQILASFIVIVYPHLRGWDRARGTDWLNNTVTAQFWYVLFAEAMTIGATWWFVRRRKGSLRAIGWRRPRWFNVVSALAGFFVYFVAYTILFTVLTQVFTGIDVNQKQQLGFAHSGGFVNLSLTFISLVALPPLAEELVFRGFIFTALRGRMKFVWSAVLTSAIFATAHLQFGSGAPPLWTAAIDTFSLSLVLCYLRERNDSLWPGIFLHALKNGIAFVTLFLIHVH